MNEISKFDHIDGQPDEEQVEAWADEFFFSLLNILNAFFSTVDINEAAERMSLIPFEELLLEQLEDEGEEIKKIAARRILELAETEVAFMKAYGV